MYASFDSWRVSMFRCHMFWLPWNLGQLEISQIRHSKCGTGSFHLLTDGQDKNSIHLKWRNTSIKLHYSYINHCTNRCWAIYIYIVLEIGECVSNMDLAFWLSRHVSFNVYFSRRFLLYGVTSCVTYFEDEFLIKRKIFSTL